MPTRYPEGAPTSRLFKIWQKFSPLMKIGQISPGSITVIATVLVVSLGVGAVIVYPSLRHDYFKKIQEENFRRASLTREKITAPGMNTWRDPFESDREAASK